MTQLQKDVFIGRESFISDFTLTLEQIKEDQGQILSIEGPVGIGSSTLLSYYESIMHQKQCLSMKSQLSPDTLDPLQCFRDWALQLINLCKTENIKLSQTEHNILLALNTPEIHSTLPYEGSEFDQAVVYTFKQIIERFNHDHLIFIIEDLTFAPNTSIEYLATVFESFENNKTLLLYTQVPKHVLPWQKNLNYNEQKLPAFTHGEVHQFCILHLKADYIASSVIKNLLDSSKGNPLYLEKLLEHALKQKYIQYLEDNNKRSIILKKDISSIPKDLSELLLARFHSLPELSQQLLLHCCVFGYEDNADHLKAYLEHCFNLAIDSSFNTLFSENFLDVTSNFPQHKYRFNHALLYETLLKQLSHKQKMEIHTKIAEFLHTYKDKIELDDLIYKIAGHAQKSGNDILKTQYSYLAGLKSYQNNQFQISVQHFKHLSDFINDLSIEQLENYTIYKTKALIATESLEHAYNFISKARKDIQFDKPIFDYLEAEISHHQNQYQNVIDKTQSFSINDLWAQKNFPDLLPMRLKSLLNNGDINTTVHESLSTLRNLLVSKKNQELEATVIGKLLLAATYSRKTSSSTNLALLLNQYVFDSFSVKTRVDLHNNINRWYLSSQRFEESIVNTSKAIQLCEKHFLINIKSQMILYKGVTYSYLGQFSSALEHYKTASDTLYKLNNLRQSYNAFLYYIDCLLDQGAIKAAENEFDQFKRYKDLNKSDMNHAIESIIYATYYFYNQKYLSAYEFFEKSADHYEKANFTRVSFRERLRALILKTYIKDHNTDDIINQYKKLRSQLQKNTLDDSAITYLNIAYFMIQSLNIDIPAPTKSIDRAKITDTYTKQWYYIAKINQLQSTNCFSEAQNLISEYEAIRMNILQNVPSKFKQDFINHPVFKVPSLH